MLSSRSAYIAIMCWLGSAPSISGLWIEVEEAEVTAGPVVGDYQARVFAVLIGERFFRIGYR